MILFLSLPASNIGVMCVPQARLEQDVASATARIAAIQQLVLRVRAEGRAQSKASWPTLVRDANAGKHVVAWLVRCLSRLASSQTVIVNARQRIAELQSRVSKLQREKDALVHETQVSAAKTQIEQEERILMMLECSAEVRTCIRMVLDDAPVVTRHTRASTRPSSRATPLRDPLRTTPCPALKS